MHVGCFFFFGQGITDSNSKGNRIFHGKQSDYWNYDRYHEYDSFEGIKPDELEALDLAFPLQLC